jgi:hypothetical protein
MFSSTRIALLACGALLLTVNGRASILTFDNCGTSVTAAIQTSCFGGPVNQNYGDRVTGANSDAGGASTERSYGESGEGYTPNVLTSYSTGLGWGLGFSTLTNVLYMPVDALGNPSNVLNITFTADAGFQARLLGFSLGAFFDTFGQPNITSYSGVSVLVLDESNATLFSQNYNLDALSLNQAINVTGSNGGSLTLRLDLSGVLYNPDIGRFDREYVGIDNIRFAQQSAPTQPSGGEIPEPSTFALVGGAALLAAFARKRR